MPDLQLKAGDTYPPVVSALTQNGLLLDLTNATAITFAMKGAVTVLITGTATKLTVVTPTVTTTIGSNVLTSVSSFTNIVIGGSIQANGVPPGARVIGFNAAAQTITMGDNLGNPITAIVSATVTATINFGCVSYTFSNTDTLAVDNYNVEHKITWTGGGTTRIPNIGFNTIVITASLGE